MLRQLHSLLGVIAALMVIVLSVSGAVLSVQPTLQRMAAAAAGKLTVAELAAQVATHYRGIESIQRTPSGSIRVYYSNEQGNGVARIDPQTGLTIPSRELNSGFIAWLQELHRSLLLGEVGRALVGISAALLVLVCISGLYLLVGSLGGWRLLFAPIRGSLTHRIHSGLGRLLLLAVLFTALTGSYLSAVRFNLLPEGEAGFPDFPTQIQFAPALAVAHLPALQNTRVTDLEELIFPYQGDPQDFFLISTTQGRGYIEQSSGKMLTFAAHSHAYKLYQLVYRLHSGEGWWWLGLLLGIASLHLSVICVTGVMILWQRWRRLPKLTHNCSANLADTVILVGSESSHTWGFAEDLHNQLDKLGYQVRTTVMNRLESNYPQLQRLMILTSTYGDGEAPASAKLFLTKLAQFSAPSGLAFAVLGFGDRQFLRFGQYAKDVNAALISKGFSEKCPLTLVDRQSAQEFRQWGELVGRWIKQTVNLTYTTKRPTTFKLQLLERVNYGVEVQAPTCILRFQLVKQSRRGIFQRLFRLAMPTFSVGDFIGIFAPHNEVARFYSLVTSSDDDILEICVRKQRAGICSSYLYELSVGEHIEGFIRPNPIFKLPAGKSPIILIGAGVGIGPLVGFIGENKTHRPIYLFWGGRDPKSDFLYQTQLQAGLREGRLTKLYTAFSRVANGCYVQHQLAIHAEQIRPLIAQGGYIMVCGGRAMASEVRLSVDRLVEPLGISVAQLQTQGRYLQDVY